MAPKTMKDTIKALQSHFTSATKTLSLPVELRRILQTFVDDHDEHFTEEQAEKANEDLRVFWEKHVRGQPQKYGAFAGVLKELRPLLGSESAMSWWRRALKPVVAGGGLKQPVLGDAQDFLVSSMVQSDVDEDEHSHEHSRMTKMLCAELLGIYLARTGSLAEDEPCVAPENAQVAQHVESILIAFGRKQPKDLFHALDDLVVRSATRLQGLTLLSSFLRHQSPHLYLVVNTPLVQHLLKCLMNDLSTTVLSVALTSLIMLLPHIPGSLPQHLPRMFLIYSRLVCWEKFSPLSTEAQRNLVTDDRVDPTSGESRDHGDVGIDPSWEKARPEEGVVEANTPELLTYFTYLYGLYPLNLMNYVRRPRRYLKNIDFPGADEFDLDQAVIRKRTEQFQQCHLLHPNFFNMTVDEELIDPKWPKMDPADVVGECHGLCMNARPSLTTPGPPPSSKLPDVPPLPPLAPSTTGRSVGYSNVSPSASHTSLRSAHSGKDTPSTALSVGDSPVFKPQVLSLDELPRPRSKGGRRPSGAQEPSIDDFPLPGNGGSHREKGELVPRTNIAYYERQLTLMRNELNFERWHKAQYSEHISQIARKNVRDATIDAELLNLTNANRALKQQLDHVCKARETTVKDAALTRKQAGNAETYMNDRIAKLKKEQEKWRADGDELERLRGETGNFRQLLVASEARELNSSHRLEIMQRDLDQLRKMQGKLDEAKHRLAEYEYREFEFGRAQRESEVLENQVKTLQMRLRAQQDDRERMKRSYTERITELESRGEMSEPLNRYIESRHSPATQALVQQAVSETQAKLAQMKKSYAHLLEKYTDLEVDHQALKSQLEDSPHDGERWIFGQQSTIGGGRGSERQSTIQYSSDSAYEPSGYGGDVGWPNSPEMSSNSDPTSKRYQPPARVLSPTSSEATVNNYGGLTWKPPISPPLPMSPSASTTAATTPMSPNFPPSRSLSTSTRNDWSTEHGDARGARGNDRIQRNDSVESNPLVVYNRTAPLRADETATFTSGSGSSEGAKSTQKKEKIKPNSEVRVYGRGGAQNIKLKNKDKSDSAGAEKPSRSFLKGFK